MLLNVRKKGSIYFRKIWHLFGMVCVILRTPSQAPNFVSFLRTRRRSPLQVGLPWLPFDLIRFLQTRSWDYVFEFGGGGSTVWFAEHARRLVTVEHDARWAEQLSAVVSRLPHVEVVLRDASDNYQNYVSFIDQFANNSFDLVVVDGRERVRCVEQAMQKVRPGGSLIVDDIERERYKVVFDLLQDWPMRRFDGLAPYKPAAAHSALWTRPSS